MIFYNFTNSSFLYKFWYQYTYYNLFYISFYSIHFISRLSGFKIKFQKKSNLNFQKGAFLKKFSVIFIIFVFSLFLYFTIIFLLFNPIFKSDSIIFPYALTEFDICLVYPQTWLLIKQIYLISCLVSFVLVFSKFSSFFYEKCSIKNITINNLENMSKLKLLVRSF